MDQLHEQIAVDAVALLDALPDDRIRQFGSIRAEVDLGYVTERLGPILDQRRRRALETLLQRWQPPGLILRPRRGYHSCQRTHAARGLDDEVPPAEPCALTH